MRSTLVASLGLPAALASPAYSLVSTPSPNLPIAALTFSGPITPGGPTVNITGTAKSIYSNILELNPSYTPWDFADFRDYMTRKNITRDAWDLLFLNRFKGAPGVTTTIGKRSPADSEKLSLEEFERLIPSAGDGNSAVEKQAQKSVEEPAVGEPLGKLWCEFGRHVQWSRCLEGYDYLRKLGSAKCIAKGMTCARVSCSWKCGMFLCSETEKEVAKPCASLADDVLLLAHHCSRRTWGDPGTYEVRGGVHKGDHSIAIWRNNC
ncbi:hypothetical protein OQA88_5176 [Cercophora sp. LCS_1]